MTWQGTKTAGLAAKARSSAKDGETRVFCFAMESPEKALDAGKHERTAIARPAEAQPVFGLHAFFEAAWRGPLMGRPKAFDCAPKDGSHARVANNPDVGARSRPGEEKGSRECGFAKARSGAGWNAVKAGVLPGKVNRAVNTLYALEAEGQRGAKKKVLRRLAPSSLKLRSDQKAGHRHRCAWRRVDRRLGSFGAWEDLI